VENDRRNLSVFLYQSHYGWRKLPRWHIQAIFNVPAGPVIISHVHNEVVCPWNFTALNDIREVLRDVSWLCMSTLRGWNVPLLICSQCPLSRYLSGCLSDWQENLEQTRTISLRRERDFDYSKRPWTFIRTFRPNTPKWPWIAHDASYKKIILHPEVDLWLRWPPKQNATSSDIQRHPPFAPHLHCRIEPITNLLSQYHAYGPLKFSHAPDRQRSSLYRLDERWTERVSVDGP